MNSRKIVPYGKCKFCGTTHRFLKTCCPAFRNVCQICKGENHFESFCPSNKNVTEAGKSNGGVSNNRPMPVNNPMLKAACLFCGENHPPDMSVCPAIGKFCCNCGKQNHTEKVCPQKMTGPQTNQVQVPSPRCGFCKQPNHSERECRNKNMGGTLKKSSSSKSINYDGRMKHCNFCGDEHSVVKGSCPAYGQRCTYCKKENHIAKACGLRIRAQEKKKLGDGNFFNSYPKCSKSSSTMALNIPIVDEKVDGKTESNENKENNEGKQVQQPKKKVVPKKPQGRKKRNPEDSSDSDNDDAELNDKKAKKMVEVASYYLMWQEYQKAKDYLIKAKLMSSHLPEVDEKLAEITRLVGQSSVTN